jgi:hypothetical protein
MDNPKPAPTESQPKGQEKTSTLDKVTDLAKLVAVVGFTLAGASAINSLVHGAARDPLQPEIVIDERPGRVT